MPKVLDRTEGNFERLARRLKEVGIPGYQVLDIEGLAGAGTPGDRRTFYITGNKIIVPYRFTQTPVYNDNVAFGVCLNEEGNDDDPWLDFSVPTLYTTYQAPLYVIEHIMFYKITIRNYKGTAAPKIRIYIFQDALWINQVNAMLRDITP
jgi:hypothetical protein